MQLKTAFLSFILLICPCAFCYGQISFLGVNGERGYSAMRAAYAWDLDNNFIFTPSYEFYRQSDEPDVEKTGSTYRYGLKSSYDFFDAWQVYTHAFWQPMAVGNQAASYYAATVWQPFYRWGIMKDPFVEFRLGQTHYKTRVDRDGAALPSAFKQTDTSMSVRGGSEIGPWNLKAA
ncbi:MAG: hypothetical protein MJ053_04255, partial [Elusimicrobiaceae bacterium]|nr:hypothetical protein [Elusimicrobiaceae bacterium]